MAITGVTEKGRSWTGRLENRRAIVEVEGIARTLEVGWPMERAPFPKEWASWVASVESRHERESTQPLQRGELPGKPGGRGGRRPARRRK